MLQWQHSYKILVVANLSWPRCVNQPLTCGDRVISVWLGQYHGCWCPGSLRRQDISSDDIDYVEYVGPGRTWERISSFCIISMWSNAIKCKYMFMFPLKNLARQGLNIPYLAVWHIDDSKMVFLHYPGMYYMIQMARWYVICMLWALKYQFLNEVLSTVSHNIFS